MNIAIIGVGLIGGSVALALRQGHSELRVVGIDRDADAIDNALRRGVIDEAGTPSAIADCDVILIAVPVRQFPAVLAEISLHLKTDAVITDAGSTKVDVIRAARAALGNKICQFVPGHPIAGREHVGVAAAVSELFQGKNVVLTPIAENAVISVERVRTLWRACGARVVEMAAETHDAVFAAVSHLPHLLAFTLVDEFASRPNAKTLFSFAASGFRDFTRIASSSPEMWTDIVLNNRDALLREVNAYEVQLAALKVAIEASDGEALHGLMARARNARDRWMAGEFDGFRDEAV
jgi:prephenate dehydrogenase